MKNNIGEGIDKKVFKAVKKELLKNNVFRSVEGDIRKNILDVVRGDECKDPMDKEIITGPCSPTDMLNLLILDYFKWMSFKYSSDMFVTESGTKLKMSRKKMRTKFKNSQGFSKNMPLLLELMTSSMKESK
ncbi:hypothetical protein ACKWTF_007255 [Chironomus riparius]